MPAPRAIHGGSAYIPFRGRGGILSIAGVHRSLPDDPRTLSLGGWLQLAKIKESPRLLIVNALTLRLFPVD